MIPSPTNDGGASKSHNKKRENFSQNTIASIENIDSFASKQTPPTSNPTIYADRASLCKLGASFMLAPEMAKRHGAAYWQGHLAAWHQSDLTQRAYCAKHGLGERAFYRWHRKEKEAIAAGKASLTLVPVSVGMPTTGNVIRLHSPGGWRIELPAGEAPWLADLLRHLP